MWCSVFVVRDEEDGAAPHPLFQFPSARPLNSPQPATLFSHSGLVVNNLRLS